jgi:hypothetical protein
MPNLTPAWSPASSAQHCVVVGIGVLRTMFLPKRIASLVGICNCRYAPLPSRSAGDFGKLRPRSSSRTSFVPLTSERSLSAAAA